MLMLFQRRHQSWNIATVVVAREEGVFFLTLVLVLSVILHFLQIVDPGYCSSFNAPLRKGSHSLVPFSNLLHSVGLGLSGPLHCGDELLVCPLNLPLPDGDLLLPLHHLDLNLLQADLLLLLSCLQLVRQLGLCFLKTPANRTSHTHLR